MTSEQEQEQEQEQEDWISEETPGNKSSQILYGKTG